MAGPVDRCLRQITNEIDFSRLVKMHDKHSSRLKLQRGAPVLGTTRYKERPNPEDGRAIRNGNDLFVLCVREGVRKASLRCAATIK